MARYLIDSHIFLWAAETPSELKRGEVAALTDGANDVAVSVATFWELSIKAALGKLSVGSGRPIPDDHFERCAVKLAFAILPVEAAETEYVRRFPRLHGDPFDRLLVAKAILDNRIFMTRDLKLAAYPGVRIFAP